MQKGGAHEVGRFLSNVVRWRILIGIWWVWRSWLARQIVALEAVGSSPTIHPFENSRKINILWGFFCKNI